MSKELILEGGKYTYIQSFSGNAEVMRYGEKWRDLTGDKFVGAMADRIEELEREIERKMSAAAFVLKERDALQADNARLREALEFATSIIGHPDDDGSKLIAATLSATPEQSLARIRKPDECKNGCPEFQVCDYCQGTGGTDKEPE